jgi:MerR family transcriptional regulator, heat shock protein HspR
MKKRGKAAHMISNVAQNYNIHPQTLRLYERQGLLKPSRSEGNTRLYTDEDLERLELILTLTRDLGVNLAGIEIILNMRDKMMEMQKEFGRFIEMIRNEFSQVSSHYQQKIDNALVPAPPPRIIRFKRPPSS